jgi:ferredoxin
MESRGGITGGLTLHDALRQFEAQGFRGQFSAREGGALECATCHTLVDASKVNVRSMRRIEGVSDPADMAVVTAIVCPNCGARGTGTFCYGPTCSPEDADVLRVLDQGDRERQRMVDAVDKKDESLVHDTGWLPGPPNG